MKLALAAGPPSPEKPEVPLPATVVMTPVEAATRRMLWLNGSAMNRLPVASIATRTGSFRVAPVAGPPSPEKLPEKVMNSVIRQTNH